MVKNRMISLYLFLFLDTYALAETCGKEGVGHHRISGGSYSRAHQYPWLVHFTYIRHGINFVCGGSLISDRLVLTAKHCASHRERWGEARVGLHDLRSKDYKSVKFKKVFYNKNNKDSDIAIILLNEPVDLKNPKIGTICLPESQNEEYIGKSVRAAGWGMVGIGEWSDILKDLNLVVHKKQNRNYLYTKVETKLENNEVVYQDPCAGDSGGPLMYNKAGRWTIIGTVVGGGYNCNTGKVNEHAKLGIWNKVTHHINWIKKIMKKFKGIGVQSSASGCITVDGPSRGSPCVFPFIFRNTVYKGCTLAGDDEGKAWCSTQVDSFGIHVSDEGKWGTCSHYCPGNFRYLNDKTTPLSASIHTPITSTTFINTPITSPASIHTPTASPASMDAPITSPASLRAPTTSPASIRTPTPSPASTTALLIKENRINHNNESTLAPAYTPSPTPSPESTLAPSNTGHLWYRNDESLLAGVYTPAPTSSPASTHAPSNEANCEEEQFEDWAYYGGFLLNVPEGQTCQSICEGRNNCRAWTWHEAKRECRIQTMSRIVPYPKPGAVSGTKNKCDPNKRGEKHNRRILQNNDKKEDEQGSVENKMEDSKPIFRPHLFKRNKRLRGRAPWKNSLQEYYRKRRVILDKDNSGGNDKEQIAYDWRDIIGWPKGFNPKRLRYKGKSNRLIEKHGKQYYRHMLDERKSKYNGQVLDRSKKNYNGPYLANPKKFVYPDNDEWKISRRGNIISNRNANDGIYTGKSNRLIQKHGKQYNIQMLDNSKRKYSGPMLDSSKKNYNGPILNNRAKFIYPDNYKWKIGGRRPFINNRNANGGTYKGPNNYNGPILNNWAKSLEREDDKWRTNLPVPRYRYGRGRGAYTGNTNYNEPILNNWEKPMYREDNWRTDGPENLFLNRNVNRRSYTGNYLEDDDIFESSLKQKK